MWTTSAKTTNVANDGDPVGYIEDSSGNGHDVHQTTAGKRPIFKTSGGLNWFEGDGATSGRCFQSVATVDQTATNTVTICSAVTVDVSAVMIVAESSAAFFSNNGSWLFYTEATSRHAMGIKGDGTARTILVPTGSSTPNTKVVVGFGTIGGTYAIRQNQTETSASLSTGAGNYGNYTLNLMSRNAASLFLDGGLFETFAYTDIKTGGDLTNIEAYLAQKSGVTL
jgi:hypothetical protein